MSAAATSPTLRTPVVPLAVVAVSAGARLCPLRVPASFATVLAASCAAARVVSASAAVLLAASAVFVPFTLSFALQFEFFFA